MLFKRTSELLFNIRVIITFLIFFICYNGLSQEIGNGNIGKYIEIVQILAHDSMQGRSAGSQGEEKAKNYIIRYFKKIGIKSLSDSFCQRFAFPLDSNLVDSSNNLIGFIDNKSDSTIIIGAHYDHIGMGGPKSRSLTDKKIHPGADDNASGVAILLMLAEFLNSPSGKISNSYNYLFVAFSAHENGLYGSEAFINGKIIDLSKIKLMLNFDMVGRLDTVNQFLKVIRSENDNFLDSFLVSVNKEKFHLKIDESSMIKTDASVFISNNITAITFSTGTHEDYHKISDVAEKINYDGMEQIFNFSKSVLMNFETQRNFRKKNNQ